MTCLGGGVVIQGQTNSDTSVVEMTAGKDALHAQLQLSTSVVEQRYCSDGRVRFQLRLDFTNAGKQPVVLDKRSSTIPKYLVSRDAKAAGVKKFQAKIERLIGLNSSGMSLESTLDESSFLTLKPGETYSLTKPISFLIARTGDKEGSIRAENHVLQIVVVTWYYPRFSNVKAREQWRQKGYVWSDDITSLPMPFNIEKQHMGVMCP